jgi:hypothetical protein
MAKKGFLVPALLALVTGASCSKGPRVLLFNDTPFDLTVRVDDKTIAADIGPGQSAEFYPQPSQSSATFPVTVLPKQPLGFPLTPARKVDLT